MKGQQQEAVKSKEKPQVTIVDVSLRDGFQIISSPIPTEDKKNVLDALVAAGVTHLEASSFVSPKAVPQMADAASLFRYLIERHPTIRAEALVPNLRGAANAHAAGVRDINYVISASLAHNLNNIRRTHEESLEDLGQIAAEFPDLRINLALATTFGCPFSGAVPIANALDIIAKALAKGATSVTLADTIGVANPRQVRFVVRTIRREFPGLPLRLHAHDTHGMGLANMFAAWEEGINCFETAAGGMGGCPFAPGAAGNSATEDTVNMFHRMGADTGINLEAYLGLVCLLREMLDVPLPGRFSTARNFFEFSFFDPESSC